MNHDGEKGLKAFAKLKLGMTFKPRVLKKHLVPVLAYKMTVAALKDSITAGDYFDALARHGLPDTAPEKAASSELVEAGPSRATFETPSHFSSQKGKIKEIASASSVLGG